MSETETEVRPPFPAEDYAGLCPNCGAEGNGNLQLTEETTRYWRGFDKSAQGVIYVYDDTTYDEGDDARIECIACQSSWEPPDELDYC